MRMNYDYTITLLFEWFDILYNKNIWE